MSEPPPGWLEEGLGHSIPVVRMGSTKESRGRMSRFTALDSLRRIQRYMGWTMLLAAATGIYLLATDHSLWILAISHAVGLVIIVILDVTLGVMNLAGVKRIYLASLAAAVLGIVLQVGDISTAPQYGMSVAYFASYLFGLASFDALLILQAAVMILGIVGRTSVGYLATKRGMRKELNYSRRTFVTTIVGFAALVGIGVALGSIKVPAGASSPASSAVSASATTPIANESSLQVNSPVYFEYPSGYPNVLLKRSDGTLAAFSILCTHVCCETTWEPSQQVFFCGCHGSVFDSSGRVLRGPAGIPLPSITLNVDASGNIFPTGVSGSGPC